MNGVEDIDSLLIGLVGGGVLAAAALNSVLTALRIPPLVGYIGIGFALRLIDDAVPFLSEPVVHSFRFMADLGIVALLFSIGLQSHPSTLAAKLPLAAMIWVGDVVAAFGVAFAAAYWLLHVDMITATVVATALSATSVGVAVGVWRSARSLQSPAGNLLVDVAELDDISAVALMAVLFAVAPILRGGGDAVVSAGDTIVRFAGLLIVFVSGCLAFAQYGERHVTAYADRMHEPPQRMLVVAGVGFLIAATAGVMGFSLAIGALAAGLVFSRDPAAVRTDKSFNDITSFVTPFFFIGIGLQIDPESLQGALLPGLILVAAAVGGKLLGNYVPALFAMGAQGATLLALSMVPRAEITMVVMDQARPLLTSVPWLYSAMVLVTAVTSLGAPLILLPLLKRWPQVKG
jgi:Kef-type K+ transport system membrane component KefB